MTIQVSKTRRFLRATHENFIENFIEHFIENFTEHFIENFNENLGRLGKYWRDVGDGDPGKGTKAGEGCMALTISGRLHGPE